MTVALTFTVSYPRNAVLSVFSCRRLSSCHWYGVIVPVSVGCNSGFKLIVSYALNVSFIYDFLQLDMWLIEWLGTGTFVNRSGIDQK